MKFNNINLVFIKKKFINKLKSIISFNNFIIKSKIKLFINSIIRKLYNFSIIKILFNIILNIIYKKLKVTIIFLKKYFKIFLLI